MFKKAILTISALALSAGMLVTSANAKDSWVDQLNAVTNAVGTVGGLFGLGQQAPQVVMYPYGGGGGFNNGGFGGGGFGAGGVNVQMPQQQQQQQSGTFPRTFTASGPSSNRFKSGTVSATYFNGKVVSIRLYDKAMMKWSAISVNDSGNGHLILPGHGPMGYVTTRGKSRRHSRRTRYVPTRLRSRSMKRRCLRNRRCAASYRRAMRKMKRRGSKRVRYIPTRLRNRAMVRKCLANKRCRRSYKRKSRRSRYIPTRGMSFRQKMRICKRSRRCMNKYRSNLRRIVRNKTRRSRKAKYLPTRYKRKLALKKRRALKRRRALRKSRYNVTRYKRKAAAKRRALKRRRILRKRRALRRSKYKRTSYRGRRHLRRRVR